MKIENPAFFTARMDKGLDMLVLIQRHTRNGDGQLVKETTLKLCIENKGKYSDISTTEYIQIDTEIFVQNFSSCSGVPSCTVSKILWFLDVTREFSPLKTFLKAVKKGSDVRFHISAFKRSDFCRRNGGIAHSLYGIVDGHCYFLDNYVGEDNSASPIR